MTQVAIHDFNERLQWSESKGDEPFWNAVYAKAFHNIVNMMRTSGNTASQRQGIDRIIHLSNGKSIQIDEKKREKDYDDILLEYVSVDKTGAPGWIEKDLNIDYLAYAFMPSKRCYLFPWELLRRAWIAFGKEWKKTYPRIPGRNNGYTTYSVAVPISIVKTAVSRAMIIDVSSELPNWNYKAIK